MHILVLSPNGVRIWLKCTPHPGTRKRCWDVFSVDAGHVCMSEEAVVDSQRNVCGKRFSSHAEQLLMFKRKTGQGFKWSLHTMQVSLCKSMCVFVGLDFRSPRPQALWLCLWTDTSLFPSFKALCCPVQFSSSN